jgi:cytochrome P450
MTVAEARRPQALYDPFDPAIHADPYPAYALLRDEHPVYRNEERDFWAISRFDDVQAALRDWQTYSNATAVDLDGTSHEMFGSSFAEADPPRHDVVRKLVREPFGPKQIAELEQHVRRLAAELVAPLAAAGGGDLARDVGRRLTMATISHVMGFPHTDEDYLVDLLERILIREPGTATLPAAALAAADEAQGYLRRLLDAPADDGLMRMLAAARAAGELGEQEAVDTAFLFLLAGNDTPSSALSTTLLLLAEHPEQRDWLRANLDRIDDAIEELLRYDAPLQNLARKLLVDVELHGCTIPAGGRALVLFGSANRDPRRFPDGDRLDLGRAPLRNVAFGEGIHFCLGARLSRLELRATLRVVLERIPDYVVSGEVVRWSKQNERGLVRLPVRCDG